jgi:hypothetical protein
MLRRLGVGPGEFLFDDLQEVGERFDGVQTISVEISS